MDDKSISWVFPHTQELQDTNIAAFSINERDYFDERRKSFGIVFKKEPPKAVTQAFEVSVFLF